MGQVTGAPIEADAAAIDAAKTYLRIDGEDEDPTLAALIATAVAQCEAYIGAMVLQRTASETMAPRGAWQWLTVMPVRAMTGVVALALNGTTTALPGTAYELDIDANGRGRIRFLAPVPEGRVIVTVTAGLAASWTGIAEPLRQGIVRMVAHHHLYRERADELGPPAAVMALWRMSRRVQL